VGSVDGNGEGLRAGEDFPPAQAESRAIKNPPRRDAGSAHLRDSSGVAPDRKNTVLRSRLGRKFRQLPGLERLGEEPLPAEIIYGGRVQDSLLPRNGKPTIGGEAMACHAAPQGFPGEPWRGQLRVSANRKQDESSPARDAGE
jgi:hypothetical protein